MANSWPRMGGLLTLVLLILAVVLLWKYIVALFVALLLLAILAGLLFYVRIRMALRRFRKFMQHPGPPAQGGPPRDPKGRAGPEDVLDAEFKVKDEP